MSAFLLGLGFRADMGTCVRKLVLLKLIDACEEDGSRIFPAVATVARAAQCSPRQVQRELKAFVDCGLIRLVREGGKGPKSTNEYAMDLDLLARIAKEGWAVVVEGAAEDKGDTVSPLIDDDKGDIGDSLRVTPETPKGDKLSHPTPPYPSIDPSEREGASASDGQEGEGQGGPGRMPPSTDRPGTADFEKRVGRFCNGRGFVAGQWPDWDTSSLSWIARHFAALSAEERAEAERWRDGYLIDIRSRKAKAQPVGVFLRDKTWQALDPSVLERFDRRRKDGRSSGEGARPEGWEPCLGPVGMAWLFGSLLAGPADQDVAAAMAGQRFALDAQLRRAWPDVWQWRALLRQKGGLVFVPRWHALKPAMEAVPRGTAMEAAWRKAFDDRGWPWLVDFERIEVVFCPRGGPERLDDFQRALRGGHDGDQRQAAE